MNPKKPANDIPSKRGGLNRRDFFKHSGLVALMGAASGKGCSGGGQKPFYSTYDSLGVRPVINCWGTITVLGGSLVPHHIYQSMEKAGGQFVFLDELMEKVSERLAELTGAESGIITSGAAGALFVATAACVAGTDREKMNKLPHCEDMKNEVVTHNLHRHGYERLIRAIGVTMIECDSIEDMKSKIGEKTAMISTLGASFDKPESPKVEEFVALSKETGVPLLVDAAAERPDVPNTYIKAGVDLVCYSGGKCIRGPQSTGLLLGRKDLTWAAHMHNSPHANMGRGQKIDKYEIIGALNSLEWWIFDRDHEGEWKQWEGYLKHIDETLSDIAGVKTEVRQPGRLNVTPTMAVTWDEQSAGITPKQVHEKLLNGDPRIQMATIEKGVLINPYMMEPGEERTVARRMHEVLSA